jgi:aryl-alcohol dehydrogenase-like predicted oxidoreductase
MNLGTSWESFVGGVDKEESFKLLDYYYDQGGNFIDVKLQLVVWIDGRRQRITRTKKARPGLARGCKSAGIGLATKFTTPYKAYWKKHPIHVNYAGNSTKSLHVSVNDSLRKLQTDYIDILYVH